MNKAKWIYGRDRKEVQNEQKISPFFRSKVKRQINQKCDNQLGPGHYDVSLPFVKPIFQTILKNDSTVIVKFNYQRSSAFNSKSPRFNNENKSQRKIDKSSSYRQKSKSFLLSQNESEQKQQEHQKSIQQMGGKILISHEKNNHQQRKDQKDNQKSKMNLKFKRKRILSQSKNQSISPDLKFHRQYHNSYQHRTLPVVQRLHNLEPNIFERKVFNQNRYDSLKKSTEWSKYKQSRKSFVEDSIKNFVPGPGAYKLKEPKFQHYNQQKQMISWQFNSKTLRNPFQFLQRKKQLQQFSKNQNELFQSNFSINDSQNSSLKNRILKRKNLKNSMTLSKSIKKIIPSQQSDQQHEINLEITSRSYKDNFNV